MTASTFAFPTRRRSARRRWSLALVAVLALVAGYATWWVGYCTIHLDDRYRQVPAGGSATVRGTSVTVEGLTVSALLEPTGPNAHGEAAAADAGAVWVVARLHLVRQSPGPDFFCDFALVGTDGRAWDDDLTPPVSRDHQECGDDAGVGRPRVVEQVFMVPESEAGRLAGVAVLDNTTATRAPVLGPAG